MNARDFDAELIEGFEHDLSAAPETLPATWTVCSNTLQCSHTVDQRNGRTLRFLKSNLSTFSLDYLFRIINSQSAQACDGDLLLLKCPRHSTITIQSAFYGQNAALPGIVPGMRCQWLNNSCSASTALQKVLSECQGHRNCQFLVNHQVFGIDPCPGTPKYLHVSYRCKPTEHKKKVTCEGDRLLLHCKHPKVLNIYSAVYGRQLEGGDLCPSEEQPPPFECLFHGAVDVVSNICYGKQRCLFTIDEERFKNPCPTGTKNSRKFTQGGGSQQFPNYLSS